MSEMRINLDNGRVLVPMTRDTSRRRNQLTACARSLNKVGHVCYSTREKRVPEGRFGTYDNYDEFEVGLSEFRLL